MNPHPKSPPVRQAGFSEGEGLGTLSFGEGSLPAGRQG